jgi:hypothetical protein
LSHPGKTIAGVKINRSVNSGLHPFREIFIGFEKVVTVQTLFTLSMGKVLADLMVDVQETSGYLHIDEGRRCIILSAPYLREADDRYLYLDVVHELCHIRQLMNGRKLFDRSYSYVDRPTEIEAYRTTIDEARRIGFTDNDLVDYLRVEWISEDDFKRFLRTLGVRE